MRAFRARSNLEYIYKNNLDPLTEMKILLLFFITLTLGAFCNPSDREIFNQKGHTFKTLFRSYGGTWVYQNEYEQKIVKNVGLSAMCAKCYGEAYICGWNNCLWPCRSAGPACDACLTTEHCISNCNTCTGFFT